LLVLGATGPGVRAQTVIDPGLAVTQLVSGLDRPTTMAFIAPDDLLVLQQRDGRVRRVTGGVLQPAPVLDLAVDGASERGLLGIAIHPDFPSAPFVYLYVTESSTGGDTSGSPPPAGNRVYRFTWTGAVLANPTLIASLPVLPGPNHNGGVIAFGPDRKLYVFIGDLNHAGLLQNMGSGAPDDTGVVLRLNADGTVPPDNPFAALGGNAAKYFAYGIRNSFGLAFDPVTGLLWMTENGPDIYDEINLVRPGFNSGWRQIMGPDARDMQGVGDLVLLPGAHYGDPTFSWQDPVGVTGIAFLASDALGPAYRNDAFAGDVNRGVLYRFRLNPARDGFVLQSPDLADRVADSPAELDEVTFGTGFGGITDVEVGPDGRLYVLSIGHGAIYVVSPQGSEPGALPQLDDADGVADITVFRPPTAEWLTLLSSTSSLRRGSWGSVGDLPVVGDYDGDGRVDAAVYRPSSGEWFILQSSGGVSHVTWGVSGDLPVPRDYDGDGRTDVAVYRSATSEWFILQSSSSTSRQVTFGAAGDIPAPADYDGDATADIAVFRPATGEWLAILSASGESGSVVWGATGDAPVPGDYDGDGRSDLAVYRPTTGQWFVRFLSTAPPAELTWGVPSDLPVPRDYDGDGRTDVAVYRPSTGEWFILSSSTSALQHVVWGGPGDVPVP
jgi:glucose/arabinose dehydrogenase